MFENSDRLKRVSDSIWWQVLIEDKYARNRGGVALKWVDLDHTLAMECEKRLMQFEQDSSTRLDAITYCFRNKNYDLIIPGMMQINKKTQRKRPLRRIAVTHDAGGAQAPDAWEVVNGRF
jgi:hypothetical protein